MKIAVWIVSALLALAFLFIGGSKAMSSPAALGEMSEVPGVLMYIAGWAEVLGALGLILPAATRILPVLTPVAAFGLMATMIGAAVAEMSVGNGAAVPVVLILGVLAAFVGWARLGSAKVLPRGVAQVPAEA
ncbi:DoxX family protein [Myceligenerans cantabricum]